MHSESTSAPAKGADEPAPTAVPPEKPTGPGRPRALDDAKRREICALVAGGCGLREAARYVRCNVNTIRREAERNAEFDEQLRRSETYAQLSPLRAMQAAVATHWRAAAWFLERTFPERFARPEPGAFGSRQARELLNEALGVISSEISDPFKFGRIEKRLRGTFEYYIRAACDRRRTSRGLRQAMKFFDDKNTTPQPLSGFGITLPDFDTLMNASSPHSTPSQRRPEPPRTESPSPPPTRGRSMDDLLAELRERVPKPSSADQTLTPVPAHSNLNIRHCPVNARFRK
jgi:hypothetical protein